MEHNIRYARASGGRLCSSFLTRLCKQLCIVCSVPYQTSPCAEADSFHLPGMTSSRLGSGCVPMQLCAQLTCITCCKKQSLFVAVSGHYCCWWLSAGMGVSLHCACSLHIKLCCSGVDRLAVAVIDSGVELTSSAVGASMWTNAAEVAGDGLDNDGNGELLQTQPAAGMPFLAQATLQQQSPVPRRTALQQAQQYIATAAASVQGASPPLLQ